MFTLQTLGYPVLDQRTLATIPTPTGGEVDFNISRRNEGAVTVVSITGEVDVYTAPRVRDTLLDAIGEGRNFLVVDLTEVTFLDSTGLGVLVGGLKRVKAQHGALHLAGADERVARIFKVTGLDKVIPLHDDVTQASEAVLKELAPEAEVPALN